MSSYYGWGLTGNTEGTEGKERARRVDFFVCVFPGFTLVQSFLGFTVRKYILAFRYNISVSQPGKLYLNQNQQQPVS